MLSYNYSALDRNNNIKKGSISSSNIEEAQRVLLEQGFKIIKIKLNLSSILSLASNRPKKISPLEIALFCKQMAIISKSGISITKGLMMVYNQTNNKNVKKLSENLYTNIQKGQSVSDAFKNSNYRLPLILINMIKIGELTGNMDEIFKKMREYFEKEASTKKKIVDSMIYPGVLITMSIVVINVFLLKVFPQMTSVVSESGGHLPTYATYLLKVSDFIRNNYKAILTTLISIITVIAFFIPISIKEKFKSFIIFNVPFIKTVTKDFVTARFVRSMGVLIKTGLSLVIVLETLQHAIGITSIEKKILEVKDRISKGDSLSLGLEQIGYFDSMVTNIVTIGEETGTLDESLLDLADYYDEKFDDGLKKLISIIEPVFTIFMGIVIGAIVLSAMLPMFDMIGSLSRRG
jgi:type IV pilus assembly protein PilC